MTHKWSILSLTLWGPLCSMAALGLEAGIPDGKNQFPAVGILLAYNGDYPRRLNSVHACSATLISPEIAVTAAHCVLNVQKPLQLVMYFPDFGVVEATGKPHPQFVNGNEEKRIPPFADVAILELSEPVGIEPIRIGDAPIKTGETLSVVAHGPPHELQRFSAEFHSDECRYPNVADYAYICWPSNNSATVRTCPGDSGGAILSTTTDNKPVLGGVVSYSSAGNTTDCKGTIEVENWATRLSAFSPGFISADKDREQSPWVDITSLLRTFGGPLHILEDSEGYERIRIVIGALPFGDLNVRVQDFPCQKEYIDSVAQCEISPANQPVFIYLSDGDSSDIPDNVKLTVVALKQDGVE